MSLARLDITAGSIRLLAVVETQILIQGLIVLGREFPHKQREAAPLIEELRADLGMDPTVNWRRLGGWAHD